MRLLIYCTLALLSIAASNSPLPNTSTGELNGTWIPVQQEMAGKQWPAAMYEKQKLVIDDKNYILTAESVDKGELSYSSGKMDLYPKEGVNAGKHFTAIYKYENQQLSICYNLLGDAYPEAFETKSKPMLFLSVFKKALDN